jgi:ferrous iron transport protein B
MYREVGSRWALLGVLWSTGLGYGTAVLYYQAATFARHPNHSLIWIALILVSFTLAIYALYRAGRKPQARIIPLQFKVS